MSGNDQGGATDPHWDKPPIPVDEGPNDDPGTGPPLRESPVAHAEMAPAGPADDPGEGGPVRQ